MLTTTIPGHIEDGNEFPIEVNVLNAGQVIEFGDVRVYSDILVKGYPYQDSYCIDTRNNRRVLIESTHLNELLRLLRMV